MIAIFPEIANLVARGDIEALVCQVRKYFGGPKAYAPIIDVEQLMLYAGINVQDVPHVEAGALVAQDQGGRFTVVALVNEKLQNYVDRNILLAHLLGHFLLHAQPEIARGEGGCYAFRDSQSPLERWSAHDSWSKIHWNSDQDRQADLFALALLLPLGMIQRAAAQLVEPQKLAKFFGLPQQIVEMRLDQMAIGSQFDNKSSIDQKPAINPSKVAERSAAAKDKIPAEGQSPHQIEQLEMESAVVKGQRLIAGQRYRSQPRQPGPDPSQGSELEGSLKKLRMIARRLDSSVKL